jgi:hypothetical protein
MVEVAIEEMVGSDRSPPERLRASLGDGFDVFSARAKWRSSQSPRGGVSQLRLTPPTLSSRWEKLGRGGTEDETVKLLDGIQRV